MTREKALERLKVNSYDTEALHAIYYPQLPPRQPFAEHPLRTSLERVLGSACCGARVKEFDRCSECNEVTDEVKG